MVRPLTLAEVTYNRRSDRRSLDAARRRGLLAAPNEHVAIKSARLGPPPRFAPPVHRYQHFARRQEPVGSMHQGFTEDHFYHQSIRELQTSGPMVNEVILRLSQARHDYDTFESHAQDLFQLLGAALPSFPLCHDENERLQNCGSTMLKPTLLDILSQLEATATEARLELQFPPATKATFRAQWKALNHAYWAESVMDICESDLSSPQGRHGTFGQSTNSSPTLTSTSFGTSNGSTNTALSTPSIDHSENASLENLSDSTSDNESSNTPASSSGTADTTSTATQMNNVGVQPQQATTYESLISFEQEFDSLEVCIGVLTDATFVADLHDETKKLKAHGGKGTKLTSEMVTLAAASVLYIKNAHGELWFSGSLIKSTATEWLRCMKGLEPICYEPPWSAWWTGSPQFRKFHGDLAQVLTWLG